MHLGGLHGLPVGPRCMVSECEMRIFLWSATEETGVRRGEMVAELWLGMRGRETDGRTAACNGMQLRSAVCSLWGTRRDRYDASLKWISSHESPQPPLLCVFTPSLSLIFPPPFILASMSVTAAMRGSQLENPLIVSDKNRGGDGEKIDGKRN